MRLHGGNFAFRLITCSAISAILAFGQAQIRPSSPGSMKKTALLSVTPELAAQILDREKAIWEAAKQRDMHRFAALVADDARMVFVSGVMTKQEYMQSASARTIADYSLEDFQFFMPAKEIVITFYKATVSGTANGRRFPASTVRESSFWVNRNGEWVAVWNQETPIQ